MMKNLFDTKISFYENVADNVGTEISLRDFLFCDQYKEQIEHIRSIVDEEQQKSLKKKLPQATISGTFAPTRKAENLVAHSNLLCIDIDRKDNPDVAWFAELRNVLQLVCEGHLRSFTGKTYVRLWNTLACVCEEHLLVFARNTCLCLRGTLACACEEHLHVLVEMTSCAPAHHAPRTIFNFYLRVIYVTSYLILLCIII